MGSVAGIQPVTQTPSDEAGLTWPHRAWSVQAVTAGSGIAAEGLDPYTNPVTGRRSLVDL